MTCKSVEQCNKEIKLQSVCKIEMMEKRIIGELRGVRGVISQISINENLEELRKLMKWGTVTGIWRLQTFVNEKKSGQRVSPAAIR